MNEFSKQWIKKKNLNKLYSQTILEKLGYSANYLDKCIEDSFAVWINDLFSASYINKDYKILKDEYTEILKYKITSFPTNIINDYILYDDIIKEELITIHLWNKLS